MLRESYRNFNMCLFTLAGTPLPLDDDEALLYTAEKVNFYITVGEGGFFNTYRHSSPSGTIFVTNCRLIYIPAKPTFSFCSFFIKTTAVLDVAQKGRKTVLLKASLNGNISAVIKLKMGHNLPDTFIKQLSASQEYLRVRE
ncbi:hypothetical protein NEMIN01_1885 [Nematocida minor]|uniref:uncharacterized protein n=1 Tax=Nematocida minor TaxID=1912983 RepID=UPI0022201454|nr:uncharacterized protein NEMIN01_1885 [Nematocida minor]KAI5192216.1 hypothetical protein NEMIN01_1885 [Nematocida minor]